MGRWGSELFQGRYRPRKTEVRSKKIIIDYGYDEGHLNLRQWRKCPNPVYKYMAGLGTDDRRSAQPLAPREQLRFTYFLLWDMQRKRKNPQANPTCPRTTFAQNKKFCPKKRIFGARAGCGDVTSLYKNLVKNRKTNFRRQAIQGPIFSVAKTDCEGGCDGRGCVCGTFLVICTQPSHSIYINL
jgi:hypothetical protein